MDEDDERKVLAPGSSGCSANTISHDRARRRASAFSDAGGMPGYDAEREHRRLPQHGVRAAAEGGHDGIPDGERIVRDARRRRAAAAPAVGGKRRTPGRDAARRSRTRAATLNDSQRTSSNARALTRRCPCGSGPAGLAGRARGRDRTVVADVSARAEERFAGVKRRNRKPPKTRQTGPVALACAASNVAGDNIVAGFAVSSDTRRGAGA